jgi:prepilin-type N-terminal cleavage/methylation domain-containing protein
MKGRPPRLKPVGREKAERRPKPEARTELPSRLCATTEAAVVHSGFGFRLSAACSHSAVRARRGAFTLIELILVMALLTMTASITAPTLAKFFRGRTLDSEARRLLAMTRSGQDRAISEGIPMDLWVDGDQGIVGLDAEPSFEKQDPKAVQFDLDNGVRIEAVTQTVATNSLAQTSNPLQLISTASVLPVHLTHSALPTIRFLPDGSVGDTSPEKLRLSGRDGSSLWIALSQDRMSYEIRATENQPR